MNRRLAAAALAGVLAAALVGFGATHAFADTLFSDDFQDGNSNGWSRSGGTWTVVPSAYYSYTVADPNTVKSVVMAGAGTGRL
jgi:pectate lyase